MAYADTDFFLALLKSSDSLKFGAEEALERHKGNLTTSIATFIELAFVARDFDLDIENLFSGALQLAECRDGDSAMVAAHYLKHKKVGVLDAFHAALSGGEPIISSDKVFDRLGLKRIPLERLK